MDYIQLYQIYLSFTLFPFTFYYFLFYIPLHVSLYDGITIYNCSRGCVHFTGIFFFFALKYLRLFACLSYVDTLLPFYPNLGAFCVVFMEIIHVYFGLQLPFQYNMLQNYIHACTPFIDSGYSLQALRGTNNEQHPNMTVHSILYEHIYYQFFCVVYIFMVLIILFPLWQSEAP